MLRKNKSLAAVPLFLLGLSLQAQSQDIAGKPASEQAAGKAVTGTIKDAATGKPVAGARVTYGRLFAAITDAAGNFTLKVPHYGVAVRVEAEGYGASEIALKGRKTVSTALFEADYPSFYQDVTLPSGSAPKSQLTAAAATVQTRGNWNGISETPDAYLQGRVAGLNAVRRSGTPNAGANLFLRGTSSLYATNQPLVVVDGVLYDQDSYNGSIIPGNTNNPLAFIDSKDIDNISVLKDGSSIYGAKGANGVLLITTARARQEATQIDAAVYGGVNFAPAQQPVMNAADYRVYLSEMLQSKGLSSSQVQALPFMNDDKSSPDYYANHFDNNWQDKVFRNGSAQNAYLKITGGDNIAKYALTMGYLKNDGSVRSTNLTRYNTRFNADLNLSKRLTASTNLSFTYYQQNLRDGGPGIKTNPMYAALVKAPFFGANQVTASGVESPEVADKDTLGVSNPAALIRYAQGLNKNYRFNGAVTFSYAFTPSLSLASTLGVNIDKIRESFFTPELGVVADTLDNAVARNRSGAQVMRVFGLNTDTRLAYTKTFHHIHQLSARLGVRYSRSSSEQDNGLGFNSATDQLKGVGYGLNSLRRIGGSLGEWAWLNTYLGADYSLLGKYFVSLNMAADGSSRFGKEIAPGNPMTATLGENAFALFPSLAGSWLVSSENFMASSRFINLLKLRASVALTGNDDIGNFTARPYYVPQNLLGISGLVRGNISNPALQWESVTKLNGGLDLSVWNERINLSVDAYQHQTDNMIVYLPAPTGSGMDFTLSNGGGMKTTGWEAALNARLVNGKNLKWDAGFTVGSYRSKVTTLPAGTVLTDYSGATMITEVGGAPNRFYGYQTAGVYASGTQAAAEGLNHRKADGSLVPFGGGDLRFVNTNSDNVIDASDRQVIGDPNPDFFGGVHTRVAYKRFSLEALFSFSQGNDVFNFTRSQLEAMSGFANQTGAVVNRWHTDGQVTSVPKATWGDPMGNSRFSDRWIEDGSYLRLKTVSAAYNLPLKPGFLKYATVYLNANNLFTLTRYKGYDPEFSATSSFFGQGVDAFGEPQYRSAQAGIRLGL
ncbi:SusC/RagA family TonB-linked outer membrane protein [Paraflavisolibacter sp. H34]|uniref:SusC/RagA family TonB-linked outer membrane protein n=1 Tax=Huijunlia imazamoxiresistens TaxID=3127457 RepID=UPI0030162546